jgi:hypothetical protein
MHTTWIGGVAVMMAMVSPVSAVRAADGTAGEPAAALRAIEEAVGRGDRPAAERLRRELHAEALASRRWQAWLLAGHAALAVGGGASDAGAMRATARRAYLSALFQARAQGSVEGVLQAAEAFARLGDHEVVEGALRIAERMPGARAAASEMERIRLAAEQLRRLAQRDPTHGRIDP